MNENGHTSPSAGILKRKTEAGLVKFDLPDIHQDSADRGQRDSIHALASRHLRHRRKKKSSTKLVHFFRWLDNHLPIVLPSDWRRRHWDFLILAFVIYNAVSVPHEAAFFYQKSILQSRIEDCVDVLFVMDVFYTFRTAYVNEQGVVVRDGAKIVKHYMQTWFPIDCAASLPLEYIILMFGINGSSSLKYLAMFKTPRLLRLGRLLRFLEKIKNANVFRIFRLMCMMCLIAHWTACIWHLLIVYNPDETFSIPTTGNLVDEYLKCFYGSFLLMVGDNINPQNNVETVFCSVMLVLGANFYATIVGNMALLVSNLNATAVRHQQKAELMQDSMRYLNVSSRVQARVQEYYDFLQTYSHPGPDLMQHISSLPTPLTIEMTRELYSPTLAKIPLFNGVQPAFLESLARGLILCVFLAGEQIFRVGDTSDALYICQKGKVAILSSDGLIDNMLTQGCFFGMLGFVSDDIRTNNAVALSNCDIMCLSSQQLGSCMRDDAASAVAVQQNARTLKCDLVHTQSATSGVLNENSYDSREWPPGGQRCDSSQSRSPMGLVSTIKVSEMVLELSQQSVVSAPDHANRPDPDLSTRLGRLEALLELMIAKADILELNQALLGNIVADVQRSTGSSNALASDIAEVSHHKAARAALQRVVASANKARKLSAP